MICKPKAENNQEFQNNMKFIRAKKEIAQNFALKVERPFDKNDTLLKLYIHHEKKVNHNKWDFEDQTPSSLIGKTLRNLRNEKIWNDLLSTRSF